MTSTFGNGAKNVSRPSEPKRDRRRRTKGCPAARIRAWNSDTWRSAAGAGLLAASGSTTGPPGQHLIASPQETFVPKPLLHGRSQEQHKWAFVAVGAMRQRHGNGRDFYAQFRADPRLVPKRAVFPSSPAPLSRECATARTRARPVKTFMRNAKSRAADRRYLAAAICAIRIQVAA